MTKISIQVINKEGFPLGPKVKAEAKPNPQDIKWQIVSFNPNDHSNNPTDTAIRTDQIPHFLQRTVRRAADNTIELITRRLI